MADDSTLNERMHDRICRNAAVIYASRKALSDQEAIRLAFTIERDVAKVLLAAFTEQPVDNNA